MKSTSKKYFIALVSKFFLISSLASYAAGAEYSYEEKRKTMVTEQIMARGVKDERVIEVMLKVPRHLFVPPSLREVAYNDSPLPVGLGQTISQPYIVAFMTEALGLKKDDKVLEIGTGSGYQAAILAEIVGEVYTIEILPALAEKAERILTELGYKNIIVKTGDGYLGWEEHAPFDAVIVTAAPEEVPQKLIEQLKVGGRMVIPVGKYYQELVLIRKREDGVDEKTLLPVRFVPMVHGK